MYSYTWLIRIVIDVLRKLLDEIFFHELVKNNTVEEIVPIPIVWENLNQLAKSQTLSCHQNDNISKWLMTLD